MPYARSLATVIVVALLVAAAGPLGAEGVPGFTTKGTLLEQRGLPMSEQDAVERVTFRPFLPTPSYSEVGLLPAFHGDDKDNPENRGIGFEYTSAGQAYLLREWPLAGGSLDKYATVPALAGCQTGHFTTGTPQHPRELAWTSQNLVFALQVDIPWATLPNEKALHAEWVRLIKRGACR